MTSSPARPISSAGGSPRSPPTPPRSRGSCARSSTAPKAWLSGTSTSTRCPTSAAWSRSGTRSSRRAGGRATRPRRQPGCGGGLQGTARAILRASISPDNEPSLALIHKAGFVEAGSQIDEIDGLELIFEKPALAEAVGRACRGAGRLAPPVPPSERRHARWHRSCASSLRRLAEPRPRGREPRERTIVIQHFRTRAATDADAVELCAFLNACTLAHQGIARFSPEDAVTRLHQAGADPRLDSFVVSDTGAIVGFGRVWRDGDDEIKFFARTPSRRPRSWGGRPPRRVVRGHSKELLPGGRWRRRPGRPTAPGRPCWSSTATGTSATT